MKTHLKIFVILFFAAFWGSATEAATPSRLQLNTMKNLQAGKAQVIVTYGTSLTEQGPWVTGLNSALSNRYGKLVKFINCGMSGCNSSDGVTRISKVLDCKPDLVFIEFGINDAVLRFHISVAQARMNLEKIIETLKNQNPSVEIILMTMNPPTGAEREGKRPDIEKYYEMYRQTAIKLKLPLIDHYREWQKLLTRDPKTFQRYVPDGLHPGKDGSLAITLPGILHTLGL